MKGPKAHFECLGGRGREMELLQPTLAPVQQAENWDTEQTGVDEFEQVWRIVLNGIMWEKIFESLLFFLSYQVTKQDFEAQLQQLCTT